jgi:hypothetical protein
MPGHLLTFEVSAAGDEVVIHGDPAGLRLLASRLATLAAKAQTSDPMVEETLSTSIWGGHELSLEPQGASTKLVHHVRIITSVPRT